MSLINQKMPGFRFVSSSDYLRETIEMEKQYHDGNECLSVTTGDFDGNKRTDIAFLVTDDSGREKLVVARSLNIDSWTIDILLDFNNSSLGTSHVNTIPPGTYEDIWGGGEEVGRVNKYSSVNQGIISGTIESSGVAYFFDKGRWIHLWLSD
jgi:hypothetical protein